MASCGGDASTLVVGVGVVRDGMLLMSCEPKRFPVSMSALTMRRRVFASETIRTDR